MLFVRKKKLVDGSSLSLLISGLDFRIYYKFLVYARIFFIERRS
jgi:hypothetical protein